MAVTDWNTTPANNTSISGINVAEGCSPANINNAIRQMMADVRGFYNSTVLTSAIGVTVQGYSAPLASIAGLTTAADKMIYTTGANTYAVADLTAFGRQILDDADAAAVRTTLGLDALATKANVTTAEIAASTLVTASETIGANNNDTTIPTSAAVKAYADAAFDPTTAAARIKTPMFTSGAAAQTQTFTGLGDYGGVGFSLFVRNTTGGETIRFQFSTNGGSSWSTAYSLISSVGTATVFTVVGHFDFNSGLFTIVGSETTTALHRASTTLSGSSLAIDAIRFTGSAAGVTCVAMITPNGGTV